MTTRELMNSLPEAIVNATEKYREARKRAKTSEKSHDLDMVKSEWYGYTKALRDAGSITEQQRKMLYIYGTI